MQSGYACVVLYAEYIWPALIFAVFVCGEFSLLGNFDLPSSKEALADLLPKPCSLVGGVLLCNVTKSLKEALADLLPKPCSLVGGVLLCNVTKSLKEAVADPTWVLPIWQHDMACADTVCVSNTINKLGGKKCLKVLQTWRLQVGICRPLTWCSPLYLATTRQTKNKINCNKNKNVGTQTGLTCL